MRPNVSIARRFQPSPALMAAALLIPAIIGSPTAARAGTILPVSSLPRVVFGPYIGIPTNDDGEGIAPDHLSLALGISISPDYEGSNHKSIGPAAGALARWHGHQIAWRGTALSFDLVQEHRNQGFKFVLAPQIAVNTDLVGRPNDPVVTLLRRHRVAAEAGAIIGFTKTGLLTRKYDQLTVQVSGLHDVGSVHGSYIITPSIAYATPLSKTVLVTASASFDIVGAGYAQSYFGIDAPQHAASGLPLYSPGGGIKSTSMTLGAVHSLSGDLRQGWAVGLLGSYEKLLGPIARSPLVAQRGTPNQFSAAVGVTYTF